MTVVEVVPVDVMMLEDEEDEVLVVVVSEDEVLVMVLSEDEVLVAVLSKDELLVAVLSEDELLVAVLSEDELLVVSLVYRDVVDLVVLVWVRPRVEELPDEAVGFQSRQAWPSLLGWNQLASPPGIGHQALPSLW